MTLIFFFAATTINGSLIHVVPLLTDRGIAPGVAAGMLSSAGLALIIGRMIAGYLLDKIFAPYIAVFFLLCPMAGIGILASGMVGSWPVAGTILLGLGVGAEIDLLSYVISRYFGIRFFGVLHGFSFTWVLIGNAAGAAMLGWFFQLTHSYTHGFVVFEILLAIGCVLLMTLGPYRYPAVSKS